MGTSSCIGKVSIEGVFACFSLEDPYRAIKIPGKTCIPFGRYEVVLSHSTRFKKELPLLLSVPNFTGIRIHCGNRPEDTEGCILVGMEKGVNTVFRSQEAMHLLFGRIKSAIDSGQKVYISIERPPLPEPAPRTEGFVA